MNLNLILPLKKIILPSGKEVSIPKLGLKHYNMLKEVKGPDENLDLLINSICPGLTSPEVDLVCIHILEFNGKLKSKVEKDGATFDIKDIRITQKLEFQYQGHEFKFRAPGKFEQFATISHLLRECYLGQEPIDFMKMPAFIISWAEDISTTISIQGPQGDIKGLSNILRLFE